MKFDKIIKSFLNEEEISKEDRLAALKRIVSTGDGVKVIYFNIDKTDRGYPEKQTRIVAIEHRDHQALDDTYREILANADPNYAWGTILNDGWGEWRNDVRFITRKSNTMYQEHNIFLFAFLIPPNNKDWFTEFDKLEGDVEVDGLQYVNNDRQEVPNGWDIDLKEAWDDYVMSVLYDYGWLDKFRD